MHIAISHLLHCVVIEGCSASFSVCSPKHRQYGRFQGNVQIGAFVLDLVCFRKTLYHPLTLVRRRLLLSLYSSSSSQPFLLPHLMFYVFSTCRCSRWQPASRGRH